MRGFSNVSESLRVKELGKSVNISQRYGGLPFGL